MAELSTPAVDEAASPGVRSRIVAAAVRLVAERGAEATTTRAVASAASTQTPTIFRLFGDKEGLMDAVAEQTLRDFVATKGGGGTGPDPAEDLRQGMIAFMEFGVVNPDVFAHMYARLGKRSEAAAIGFRALCERVHRVALAGRLRTTEERACDLFHATARGTVLVLLEKPEAERRAAMEAASHAALAAILDRPPPAAEGGAAGCATALRARLGDLPQLTRGEKSLMEELLDRIAAGASPSSAA